MGAQVLATELPPGPLQAMPSFRAAFPLPSTPLVTRQTPSDISDSRPSIARRSVENHSIEVIPLRGRRDRARLVDLPYQLHRGAPTWVPPLRRDIRQMMDARRSRFFDHGEAQFGLAWRAGQLVGRISAQINRLHLETHRDETGNFGMLEA